MENEAPIQFLTPPGAEQAEPNILAAAIVLGVYCAFLVFAAVKWARRPRQTNTLTPVSSWSRMLPRKRSCRWRLDKRREGVISTRWTCTTCGVEAYTPSEKPPRECKRGLRPASL